MASAEIRQTAEKAAGGQKAAELMQTPTVLWVDGRFCWWQRLKVFSELCVEVSDAVKPTEKKLNIQGFLSLQDFEALHVIVSTAAVNI